MKQTNTTVPLDVDSSGVDESALRNILKQLNHQSGEIQASAVISTDGLIKAEMLEGRMDHDRFGAMCASLLSLSKRAAFDSACGDVKVVLIEGTEGSMMVVQIGEVGVLALATKPKSKIGMIFVEARKAAKEIESILS